MATNIDGMQLVCQISQTLLANVTLANLVNVTLGGYEYHKRVIFIWTQKEDAKSALQLPCLLC